MESDRSTLALKQWNSILNAWLFCDKKTREMLLKQYPQVFAPIVYSLSSRITVVNDIIDVRDAWKLVKRDTKEENNPLYVSLDQLAKNHIGRNQLKPA